MNPADDFPLWGALFVALFLVGGAALTLIGAVGALRLRSFYERVHAPTLGTTWGAAGVLIATIIYFSILKSGPQLQAVLIALFLFVTTPVTLVLLVRAALYRDRSEGTNSVPPLGPGPEPKTAPDA